MFGDITGFEAVVSVCPDMKGVHSVTADGLCFIHDAQHVLCDKVELMVL